MSREAGFIELTPRKSQSHSHPRKESQVNLDLAYVMLEAAKQGSPAELEALLRDGVSPNVVDPYGKSSLQLALSGGCSCGACVQDTEACVSLLLGSNQVDANVQDETGNTALHTAIDRQLTKCTQMLISYGADVNLKNEQGEDAVELMTKKMPHSLLYLLNESIYIDKYEPHHEKCDIKVDFRPIIGSFYTNLEKVHSDPNFKTQKNPSDSKTSLKASHTSEGEMKVLMNLLEKCKISGEQILTHPLVQIFLHLKWNRVRPFFWASLVFYILWVILYTSYVLQVYVFSCPCQLFKRPSAAPQELIIPEKTKCEIETGLNAKVLIIIVSTFLLLLTELGRLMLTPRLYTRSWLNLGHWVLIACVFSTTIPNLQSQTSISALQYQVAAFTVFLAWAYILPQIGKLPSLAKYVEIFGHVVKSFGSFILTFVSLYIGFALAFCILFFGEDNSPFANFFHSSVKVLVMMVGEIDYNDMFYGNSTRDQSGLVMGHLLFAFFVILVCIVLMNLFVGLIVSDVQALERQAEISTISSLIMYIFHLESPFLSKNMPSFVRKLASRMFSVNRLAFTFRPNDSKDKSIPISLAQKALRLSETSYRKTRSQRCVRGQMSEPELVEIQSCYPPLPQNDPHHTSTSSTSSSQTSSPLETNSLDLRQPHTPAPFRPFFSASCINQRNYQA